MIVVTAISRSRLGRLLEALADSPLALETQGTNSSVLKVIVFCITAAMASMAGAFTGMLYHYGVAGYFDSFDSIYIVAIVIVLAIGDPSYAIIGAVGYTVIPGYVTSTNTTTILLLLFGIGAVVCNYGSRGRDYTPGVAGAFGSAGRAQAARGRPRPRPRAGSTVGSRLRDV